jgi:homocitrate synthase NifV
MSEADALARIEELVPLARSGGKQVAFCLEDGSRTPLDRIVRMFRAAQDAGADYAVLADTVGVLTPFATFDLFQALGREIRIPLGAHFHDDLGLALANTLAALQGGARVAHVTVNGVGERAGNACLEELAVALEVKYGVRLGLDLSGLADLSALVHRASGTEAPAHKAVTGKWCFTHESGIHVAGVLASQETYQAYPPALVGRSHQIVFGKHSGAHSVAYLASRSGIGLSPDGCARVLGRIKAHGKRDGATPDELVLDWIREEASREQRGAGG